MNIKFVNSDEQYPEALSDDTFGIVGGFFSTEIHPNSLEWISGIQASTTSEYSWTYGGNAYGLNISNGIAEIIGYYVSDVDISISIGADDLRELLTAWLIFLSDRIETSFYIDIVK